jgi:hypothetical protein
MIKCAGIVTTSLVTLFLASVAVLHAAWVADGIAICTVPNTQDTPAIAADGSGGAIIAWRDARTVVNTDIYGQRADAAGNVSWLADGNPVCTANNSQSLPLIAADGSGGAIVAWQDFRSNNVLDIYAQRINAAGYIQWTANGVAVCTGKTSLTLSQMIPDGSGGAIITWYDRRNASNDIFAQKINSAGAVQWTVNGVTICSDAFSQINPALATDGSGGAIIAWQDNRNGSNDIYAQSISSAGTVRWMANGIAVCNASQVQKEPQVVADGSGGAIIAWTDHRNTLDDDIYAQRVDASGTFLWTANGASVVSSMTGNQNSCRIVPAASGEAIVAWLDYRSGATADIYTQRLDASGAGLWTANGIPLCSAANGQTKMQLIPNGSGGAIATWQDERGGSGAWDVYAQNVGANGTAVWTANGVAISAAAGNQTNPQIAPDGVGGAFITWMDERAGNADIYTQRVDAAGHTVVATLLQCYSAVVRGPDIVIRWTLSEADADIEFFVLRASGPAGAFAEISTGAIARDGLSFSFTDAACEGGETYRYRVDVSEGGVRKVLFETGPVATPAPQLALYQNHPNPFNPSTTIPYFVREACDVSLAIYDIKGNLIRQLEHGRVSRGPHVVEWNGLDGRGAGVSSGVYFCRLKAGKETLSRTMILLR